jgi:hypothetical protein
MASVRQIVEFSALEIQNILGEKAKETLVESSGKQVQGSVKVRFDLNEKKEGLESATVIFERAGK